MYPNILLAAGLLSLIPLSSSSPAGGSSKTGKSEAEPVTKYAKHNIPVIGCTDQQIREINAAIEDTAHLADFAVAHVETESTAWSNYFRTGTGRDEDKREALAAWRTAGQIDNANRQWKFKFVCLPAKDPDCAGGSLASAQFMHDPLAGRRIAARGQAGSKPKHPTHKEGTKSKDKKKKKKTKPKHKGKGKGKSEGETDHKDKPKHHGTKHGGPTDAGADKSKGGSTGTRGQDTKTVPDRTKKDKEQDKNKDKGKKRPKGDDSEGNEEENARQKPKGKGKAVDEPEDELKNVVLCPPFFRQPALRQLKMEPIKKTSSGRGSAKPSPDNLCGQENLKFKDLNNRASTLLHEFTHLDWFGLVAGWNVFHKGSRGTDDVDSETGEKDYAVMARALARDWQQGTLPAAHASWPPWRNAENPTAYATELWFLKKCNKESGYRIPIKPGEALTQEQNEQQGGGGPSNAT